MFNSVVGDFSLPPLIEKAMGKCRMPLDAYDMKPEGMIAYLRYNGWHFNKKACEWAVAQMRKYNPVTKKDEEVEYMDKDKVESILTKQGVTLENNVGYDHVYVANMVKADFYKSSIEDEAHIALFVKDMVDDTDQKDGFIFNRFYADCNHNGIGIPWDDIL